jgi:hypothetical protein
MQTEPATHANSSNFDDKLHERNMLGLRRPSPSWVTGCSSSLPHGPSTAAPTPQQHGEAQEHSLNTLEKMTTEAQVATQSFAFHIIVAKLHEVSPASNLSNMPSFPDPLAEVGSKTIPPKHRLYHRIPRI